MDLRIGVIIGLVVGAVLLASILPTALDSLYDNTVNTDYRWDNGVEAGTSGANDTATFALAKLLPLFAVLGGMAIMVGVAVKEFR